jgi:hypothetical protein
MEASTKPVNRRAFFVIACRKHRHYADYVARTILLDNLCVRASPPEPFTVNSVNGRELRVVRQAVANRTGISSEYNPTQKNWLTMFDSEEVVGTVEDALKSAAMNEDYLVLNEEIPSEQLPQLLISNQSVLMHKLWVSIELQLEWISETADFKAEIAYLQHRVRSTPGKVDYASERLQIAEAVRIEKGLFLPVEWGTEDFGVLEIMKLDGNRIAACWLHICSHKGEASIGTVFSRKSGWEGFSNSVVVGRLLALADQRQKK